jgi:threonine dehydrogenase-like Zn-dependent dehydrogenase
MEASQLSSDIFMHSQQCIFLWHHIRKDSEMTTDKSMETLVWLGPRSMEMQIAPMPDLAPGEVLLEVGIAGICGSELSGYLGQNSLRKPPLIMGHEAAGHIVQVNGDGVLGDGSVPRVGRRVTFNPLIVCGQCDRCRVGYTNICRNRRLIGAHRPGAFARFVAVPAAQCSSLPDDLSLETGALTEPLACSVRAVSLSQVHPGSSLFILGMGAIGLFALAVARASGVEQIYVSDMAPSRLAIAKKWGAREVIDAGKQDVLAALQELSPGGVDAVIDAVGTTATRQQALLSAVPGSRVVFIGLHAADSPLDFSYLVRQEITIAGSYAYTQTDFARALDLLKQGVLQSGDDWVEERPLAEGGIAFAELVDGTATATKIMLRPE